MSGIIYILLRLGISSLRPIKLNTILTSQVYEIKSPNRCIGGIIRLMQHN